MAAIVSQVLGQLGSIVTEELQQRGRLVVGAQKDVKKLTSTFTAIGALLLDAEERQLKSESIENWLKKLKDVSYEIDDVLDEWRTEILKRQLLEGDDDSDGGGSGDQHIRYGCLELKLLQISDVLKRVCPFLPTYCFSTDEIGIRYEIASRIRDLNQRLEDIDKEKNMYSFAPKQTPTYSSLQTSSNVNFSEVKGREEELKELQHKLLDDETDHPYPCVRSISIQGTGGLGKTTLAKMLYNDKAVEAHFDKRVWVCVSDNFDCERVAKAILESFNQYTPGSTLPHMLERINLHTNGNKFLLVLDDVWEDSRSKWEELISSVSNGLPGSKILVTTRKEEVSRRVFRCIDQDILRIRKMSDGACRAIFTQIAFYGWSAEEKERVADLCGKVVRKCYGSPLAAKVLGGVLHLKRCKRDWIQLLISEMWEMKEGREEVLAPLALSYFDLPPAVRQCFQFSAIFPQDYQMRKDELIKLWMSQGFLKPATSQDAEQVGEEYFETLVMRSFFQDFKITGFWGEAKTYCKMHDLVHDFARLTAKNECISIPKQDDTRSGPLLTRSNHEVRHLMVEDVRSAGSRRNDDDDYLRSFIARSGGGAIEPYLLYTHLRGVRSLALINCGLEEVPPTIGGLIHLRYLDLSGNTNLWRLPEEICELYNLETLVLCFNRNLKWLPWGMGKKLVNLAHLDNSEVPAALPRSIVRVADSLKTLAEFVVVFCGNQGRVRSRRGRATNVGDLKCMNQIQGSLTITGLDKVSCAEVKRAQLAEKRSLTRLSLDFKSYKGEAIHEAFISCGGEDDDDDDGSREGEQVLEAIRPSSSLEGLHVTNYSGGRMFPSWLMSLPNLTSLSLMACNQVEHLPPFGALPCLQVLYLSEMERIREVGPEFLLGDAAGTGGQRDSSFVAFPKLTVLHFSDMKNWRAWDLDLHDDEQGMPCLRRLELYRCKKLRKVPDVLLRKTTLERLVINQAGGLRRNSWFKISHIPTVILDDVNIRTRFKTGGDRTEFMSKPAVLTANRMGRRKKKQEIIDA